MDTFQAKEEVDSNQSHESDKPKLASLKKY